MFIREIVLEEWHEGNITEHCTENPGWDDIVRNLDRLDGKAIDLMMLNTKNDGDAFIGVGGGNDGQYYVEGSFDENRLFLLLGTPRCDCPKYVLMKTGGVTEEYPDYMSVDYDTVIRAIRTFAQKGVLDDYLIWEKTGDGWEPIRG